MLEKLEEAKRTMAPEEYAAWKERLLNEAQIQGKVEGGVLPAGQGAAAVNNLPTVAEVIDRIVIEARDLLKTADGAL